MSGADLAATRLVRTAFMVRAAAAIVIHLFVTPGLFAPDEQTYDLRGDLLAKYWRGEIPMDPTTSFQGEAKGYYYIVAALYCPFGQLPFLPKLLNAWIGSLAVLELFRLTRLIGGSETAALRAAKFMAFFPSMILWSSLMIRDVWVQWLLVRLAREMAELKGRLIPSRMISAALLIWGLTLFRSYLLYAAVGPFVLSFVLGRSKDIAGAKSYLRYSRLIGAGRTMLFSGAIVTNIGANFDGRHRCRADPARKVGCGAGSSG